MEISNKVHLFYRLDQCQIRYYYFIILGLLVEALLRLRVLIVERCTVLAERTCEGPTTIKEEKEEEEE